MSNHIVFNPGPADCAKRLQSARPLCLQRGAWGVWDRKLDSCLSLTPLKVSPVAPRNPLYPSPSAPLWSPFFSVPYGAHKLSKNYHILHPTSSKNNTQIWEKVLSKPVRKTLAKNNTFESFWDLRTRDPLAQAQPKHVFPFSAPHTKNSPF